MVGQTYHGVDWLQPGSHNTPVEPLGKLFCDKWFCRGCGVGDERIVADSLVTLGGCGNLPYFPPAANGSLGLHS